jgi:hypothetical protein
MTGFSGRGRTESEDIKVIISVPVCASVRETEKEVIIKKRVSNDMISILIDIYIYIYIVA